MPSAQDTLIWALGASALVLLGASFAFGEAARTARKIILQFFVTIALPVGILLGLPLAALSYLVDLDPRLWQALIAGLVIATGWLTTAIFTELGKAGAKAERMRDYHKALYAEISNTLASLWDAGDADAHVAATLQRMRDDPDFIPFIPREHHDHIYDALVTEIDVLPRQTIDAIVAYYRQIKAISAFTDDMRGPAFRRLGQDRRIVMYADYSEMRKQAFSFGQYALAIILGFSEGGPARAEEVTQRLQRAALSTRDADPSDRSQGSE
ncbi:hypothetical protein [Sulfitobacter sabulilitoris]|uniref:Uncharacterized protein n=1 Tax=Sulfitobacter sabulilitoris TaxID=2562655 RepID=A0A5S3PBG8_9RHOB|nr:hypothetical protein [Sulfitobacter sabulilitoris]TMM50913.1 hypothetical protein FDT80_16820 [Sulfitobacter sabulilitoris]